jgi:putative aldouronate transport system substrate-binding protein
MKRKVVASALVLVMLAALFAACTSSNDAPTASPPPRATPAPPPGQQQQQPQQPVQTDFFPLANPISIRMMLWDRPQEDTGDPRITWQVLEEVTNISVEIQWLRDRDQLPLILAARDWPDLFWHRLEDDVINEFGVVGNRLINYVDWLDDMPNLTAAFEFLPDARRAITQSNGGIYQLFLFSPAATSYGSRMHYRTDILADAGVAVPSTTEQFYDMIVKLRGHLDHAPISPDFPMVWLFAAFGPGVNMDFDNPLNDGTVQFMRTSDQYRHFLRFMNRLFNAGAFHPELLYHMDIARNPTLNQTLVDEGRFVFSTSALQLLTLDKIPSGNWDLSILEPITSPQYQGRTIFSGPAPWGIAGGAAVNAASPHIEAIVRMLDIAYAQSEVVPGTGLYGPAFFWGPEGVTWEYTQWDTAGNPTGHRLMFPESFMGVTYGPDFAWTTQTQQENIVYAPGLGMSLAFLNSVVSSGDNNEVRQRAAVAHSLPFGRAWWFPPSIVTAQEQAIIDQFWTEINNNRATMDAQFITGVSCIENDWNAYVAQMNAMGLPQVLAVRQAAYTRWRNA